MQLTKTFLFLILLLGTNAIYGARVSRAYDVQHYKLSLELDPRSNPEAFEGTLEVSLKALGPLSEIELDREELALENAADPQTGKSLKFDTKNPHTFRVSLPKPLKKDESAKLRLRYTGKIRLENRGFFKVTDPDEPGRGPLLFTTLEPKAARTFFPCNDTPNDKATTEMVVTVPAEFEALSNGSLVTTEKEMRSNRQWKTVRWLMDKPHSTYLVSLAVGPFAKISDSHQGKEVSVWVGEAKKDQARFSLETTKEALSFFETYLEVPYPWSKYATVGLPTFIWGGMENTSSTHMNQNRTLLTDPKSEMQKLGITGLAAHELAHQWFGDYATLDGWEDLWLNESFASFLGSKATDHHFKNQDGTIHTVLDTWDRYFRQENGPRSHPIVDKGQVSAEDAFDAISYTKGENVLRMLEYFIGSEAMRAGLKTYLQRYALSNASYLDFFKAMSDASRVNLDTFRDTWLLQRGYPVITYSGNWASGNYDLELKQHSNHTQDKSLFHFRMPVSFHRKTAPAYSKTVSLELSKSRHAFKVALPAAPEWVSLNEDSIVLAKIQQQHRNENDLKLQALQDPNDLIRIRAAFDLASPIFEGTGPLSPLAEATLGQMLESDASGPVRIAVLYGISDMKTRWLPKSLGLKIAGLTSSTSMPQYFSTRHQALWHAGLLGALGKVQDSNVLPLLVATLNSTSAPLDSIAAAASALAAQGNDQSVALLQKAAKIQATRGYSYRYMVDLAFGSVERPEAASEIHSILENSNAELAGKLSGRIVHNQALRSSPEWAAVLKEFVLKNTTHGDEVKARLLQTVEETRTKWVLNAMDAIAKQSQSERLSGLAKKILNQRHISKAMPSTSARPR